MITWDNHWYYHYTVYTGYFGLISHWYHEVVLVIWTLLPMLTLTSDIQDLVLSDFQLLLVLTCDESMRDFSPGEFHPDASQAAVGGYGALNKPLSLGCHFWGGFQVPRSTWGTILIMTWDLYSSNFDGYGYRRKSESHKYIKYTKSQNDSKWRFPVLSRKMPRSFNHDLVNRLTHGDD